MDIWIASSTPSFFILLCNDLPITLRESTPTITLGYSHYPYVWIYIISVTLLSSGASGLNCRLALLSVTVPTSSLYVLGLPWELIPALFFSRQIRLIPNCDSGTIQIGLISPVSLMSTSCRSLCGCWSQCKPTRKDSLYLIKPTNKPKTGIVADIGDHQSDIFAKSVLAYFNMPRLQQSIPAPFLVGRSWP